MNITQLWILLALGQEPSYAYGLSSRIAAMSYMEFRPSPARVQSALITLQRRRYVRLVWMEFSERSPEVRRMYTISSRGAIALEAERRRLRSLLSRVDAVTLHRAQLAGHRVQVLG